MPRFIDHWQRFDATLAHQRSRFVQCRAKLKSHHGGRHAVGAAQVAEIALVRGLVSAMQKLRQIVMPHVEHLVVMRHRGIEISLAETLRQHRRTRGNRLRMRVGTPQHAVVEHASHKEFANTGNSANSNFVAWISTTSNAVAPPGGCRQRGLNMTAIANPTATALANAGSAIQRTQALPTSDESVLLPITAPRLH